MDNLNPVLFECLHASGLYENLLADVCAMRNKKSILDYNVFLERPSKDSSDKKSKIKIVNF
jgi:hypothetical protein